jgi:subtilase family serine protease
MRALRFALLLAFTLGLCLITASVSRAQDRSQYVIHNSRMGFVTSAADLGPESASKQITIYVWLQFRNPQAFEQTIDELYDPSSANYQKWLTTDQFNANFGPTTEDVATVESFLSANGLKVSSVDEGNLYVTAQGTIAAVQKAFTVEIHRFDVRGKTYRANVSDPVVEGAAGALIARVGGLSDYALKNHAARTVNPSTGKPVSERPLSSTPKGAFFSPYCLQGVDVENFTTDGGFPKAMYAGNAYGALVTNTAPGTLAPCGYQPSDLQTAYGFNTLYKAGLNGAGQSVVIVDAWGSPTIAEDASAFSSFYGLPPINLKISSLAAPCPIATAAQLEDCQGWAVETSLDVEYAHTVAPGATVKLVEGASDNDDDLVAAIAYALEHHLGDVISNSYGESEAQEGLPDNDPFDPVLKIAAAEGVSVNFSSGDDGDLNDVEGYKDVNYPASSPYATAVGGTSLFLNQNLTLGFQTGWGDNFTQITNAADAKGYSTPLVPPDMSQADGLGFYFGAGGGVSGMFRKPSFQSGLPGRFRLLPDISYLADPQTGVELFCTGSSCFNNDPTQIYIALIGGTSLSCPMFSSVWAISTQHAGRPLGQASRSLYDLPSNAISDIVPEGSPLDAAGLINLGRKEIFEGPYQLIGPESLAPFLSGLFEAPDGTWLAVSFGTDSSLSITRGWDDVTGLGTPNAPAFVNAFAPHH